MVSLDWCALPEWRKSLRSTQNSHHLCALLLPTLSGILSCIFNKFKKRVPSITASRSSDEAEELLPAAPGEGFHPSVREPPLFAFACFVLNGGKDGRVKGLLQVLLREGGALDVVGRPDLLADAPGPGAQHGLDFGAVQVDEDVDVQQEVQLGPDQNDGGGGVVGPDLWDPLLSDVVKGGGVNQAEAEEEDVGVGVGQRSEFIKLLLDGSEADRRMSEKWAESPKGSVKHGRWSQTSSLSHRLDGTTLVTSCLTHVIVQKKLQQMP